MRVITALSAATVFAVSGCSGERVVNTGEFVSTETQATASAPELPPVDNAHMVDAFNYVARPNGDLAAYYFTTPSGRWQCAILPRDKAGCQSAGGALAIAGAPDSVPDATGNDAAPNAVVVEPEGDPHFAVLNQPGFTLLPGPAKILPFNRTLIVARFRCNVQEDTGVSCLSEESGKGFTFSADGFTAQYSEVPVDAP